MPYVCCRISFVTLLHRAMKSVTMQTTMAMIVACLRAGDRRTSAITSVKAVLNRLAVHTSTSMTAQHRSPLQPMLQPTIPIKQGQRHHEGLLHRGAPGTLERHAVSAHVAALKTSLPAHWQEHGPTADGMSSQQHAVLNVWTSHRNTAAAM